MFFFVLFITFFNYETFNKALCFCRDRVSITPAVVSTLAKKGFKIQVEENAGLEAQFRNEDYEQNGAQITTKESIYKSGDILFLA